MPPKTPITILDGGLGTLLADKYNCNFDSSTPLWSSHLLLTETGRKTLLDAQSSFVKAGADVVITASYQASFEGFALTKIGEGEGVGIGEKEAAHCMRSSVSSARDAFGGKKEGKGKVALSLGAYGACMIPSAEYSGSYDMEHRSVEELAAWHQWRLEVFCPISSQKLETAEVEEEKKKCWENVDLIAFETLPVKNEILAARKTMSVIPKGEEKPFWISCVFPGEGNMLPDGSSVKDVVNAMLGEGKGAIPMGIGINCTRVGKIEKLVMEMEDAVKEVQIRRGKEEAEKAVSYQPPSLVIYPDGTRGEIYNTVTKEWEKVDGMAESSVSWDKMMFDIVKRARERGLWKEIFVGGCCKTTPEDTSKLKKRINELEL